MLETMRTMLAQVDEKIAATEVAQERLAGDRMALVDLIETYQKLEKQNVEKTA